MGIPPEHIRQSPHIGWPDADCDRADKVGSARPVTKGSVHPPSFVGLIMRIVSQTGQVWVVVLQIAVTRVTAACV